MNAGNQPILSTSGRASAIAIREEHAPGLVTAGRLNGLPIPTAVESLERPGLDA
jgi:hypothetical protein